VSILLISPWLEHILVTSDGLAVVPVSVPASASKQKIQSDEIQAKNDEINVHGFFYLHTPFQGPQESYRFYRWFSLLIKKILSFLDISFLHYGIRLGFKNEHFLYSITPHQALTVYGAVRIIHL